MCVFGSQGDEEANGARERRVSRPLSQHHSRRGLSYAEGSGSFKLANKSSLSLRQQVASALLPPSARLGRTSAAGCGQREVRIDSVLRSLDGHAKSLYFHSARNQQFMYFLAILVISVILF